MKQRKLYMFKGLSFLMVPNSTSRLAMARKELARNGMARVNKYYSAGDTTHVLIDRKVLRTSNQIRGALKKQHFRPPIQGVKVLDQLWLVECIEAFKVLETKDYEIDINEADYSPNSAEDEISQGLIKVNSPLEAFPPKKVDEMEDELRAKNDLDNPNAKTIQILSELAEERMLHGETFKAKAYRRAIDTLSGQTSYINRYEVAKKLPGIGNSIALKIAKICEGNISPDNDFKEHSEESRLLKLFMDIHGVGYVFAKKWINQGMKSLEDIAERDDLTKPQKLGLKYYEDWNERIPRDECTVHGEYLKDLMQDIDPEVELTIGGSYRRGQRDCGDIDFMVTKPDADLEYLQNVLSQLTDKISQTGYLKCQLGKPSSKLLAGCALPPEYQEKISGKSEWGKCRRVDFLLVPWKERGAAFIYFTGNDYFNRLVRTKASKMGLVLNESGLYKRVSYIQGKKIKDRDLLVEGENERKIFKLLGIAWKEPHERNFGSVATLEHVQADHIEAKKYKRLARELDAQEREENERLLKASKK